MSLSVYHDIPQCHITKTTQAVTKCSGALVNINTSWITRYARNTLGLDTKRSCVYVSIGKRKPSRIHNQTLSSTSMGDFEARFDTRECSLSRSSCSSRAVFVVWQHTLSCWGNQCHQGVTLSVVATT